VHHPYIHVLNAFEFNSKIKILSFGIPVYNHNTYAGKLHDKIHFSKFLNIDDLF